MTNSTARSRALTIGAFGCAFALVACNALEQGVRGVVGRWFADSNREGRLVDGKQVGEWNYRYDDGSPKASGRYEDDRQVGAWTYWYRNGNVEWQGSFEGARLDGPTFFGHENGTRRAIGVYGEGLEEGLWTYWRENGSVECEGDFAQGRPTLRWTYFDGGGKVSAEGYRLDGDRIGPWRYYGPGDEVAERRFPLPDGLEIVHESWDGDVSRREGYLVDGVKQGRWATWHTNGRRRATGDFVDGVAEGRWALWADDGEPVARGHVRSGRPVGAWDLWRNGVRESVEGASLTIASPSSGAWSTAAVPAGSPERAVATWISEACSPTPDTMDVSPDPNVGAPRTEAVAAADYIPAVRMRAQPFTVRETDSFDWLVERYTDGGANSQPPAGSGYARRSRGPTGEKSNGDPVLSPKFLGTELPWTRFNRAEGVVVDFDDYRGKKKVVVVVLRGFARDVCVYCVTQTKALCENFDRFVAEGCEVFVIYPGEKNRLDAFMESFEEWSDYVGVPPVGVLYDRNMELVQRMGITSEFAIPSTFVLDQQGVIRYSYVGENIEDRPPVDEVLEAVRGIPTR
ncbi:MAG: redoxin domain-containing protein [Planctomycetota bacterium]